MGRERVLKPIYLELSQEHTIKIKRDRYKYNREINVYGKIFYDNIPVKGAVVVLFHIIRNKKIPIRRCITDESGSYYFKFNNCSYIDEIIGITSFKGLRKMNNKGYVRTKKYNIEVNDIKDIILYGKVIDNHKKPVEGAIVAAFYDDENEMQAICHTFTDKDRIYILNIKYDLYRDKKIIVKSVNTSNSIIMDSNSEVNKVRKDEY